MDEENGRNKSIAVKGSAQLTLMDQLHWVFSRPVQNFAYSTAAAVAVVAILFGPSVLNHGVDSTLILFVATIAVLVPAGIQTFSIVINLLFYIRLSREQKAMSWEVSDGGIRLGDAAGNRVYLPWSQIRAFRERRPGYLVEQRPFGSRWLPKRAFGAEDQKEIVSIATNAGIAKRALTA